MGPPKGPITVSLSRPNKPFHNVTVPAAFAECGREYPSLSFLLHQIVRRIFPVIGWVVVQFDCHSE
jgi:hypothetical protein